MWTVEHGAATEYKFPTITVGYVTVKFWSLDNFQIYGSYNLRILVQSLIIALCVLVKHVKLT